MKTLKSIMVAAVLACMMISVANADGIKENPKFRVVVNLSFEQAVQNPGPMAAMNAQVSKSFVLGNPTLTYTAQVTYRGILYRITGTHQQWVIFFGHNHAPKTGKQAMPANEN
jgi:hypothetical protein